MMDYVYIISLPNQWERQEICRKNLVDKGVPDDRIQIFRAIPESDYMSTYELCQNALNDNFFSFYAFIQEDRHIEIPIGHLSQSRNYCRFFRHVAGTQFAPVLLIQDRRQLSIDYSEIQAKVLELMEIDPYLKYLTLRWTESTDALTREPPSVIERSSDFLNGIHNWGCDWAQVITPNGAKDLLWRFQEHLAENIAPRAGEPGLNTTFEYFMMNHVDWGHIYNLSYNGVTFMDDIQNHPSTLHVEERTDDSALPKAVSMLRPPDKYVNEEFSGYGSAVQIGIDQHAELQYLVEPEWRSRNPRGKFFGMPSELESIHTWKLYAVDCLASSIDNTQRRNNLKGIEWICASIGSEKNRIMRPPQYNIDSPMFWSQKPASSAQITLSELFEGLGLKKVDVLMLDIEGYEFEVFKEYDWRIKPKYIILEIHTSHDLQIRSSGILPSDLIGLIVDQGYELQRIVENVEGSSEVSLEDVDDRIRTQVNVLLGREDIFK